MGVRQHAVLPHPGGRTMIRPYRVHQEQIRHLKEYLKVFYSQRPGAKERRSQEYPPALGEEDSIKQGSILGAVTLSSHDAWSEETSMADTGSLLQVREEQNTPVLRCRQCGERFPLLDFYYTQKTSLCIPCWEKNISYFSMAEDLLGGIGPGDQP
jgi:hypothetical protein